MNQITQIFDGVRGTLIVMQNVHRRNFSALPQVERVQRPDDAETYKAAIDNEFQRSRWSRGNDTAFVYAPHTKYAMDNVCGMCNRLWKHLPPT